MNLREIFDLDALQFGPARETPPDDIEFHMADGVCIKQMRIADAGSFIPQHSHDYDHTSMLAAGEIRVWKDGVFAGDFKAPTGILIKAGVKHTFMSFEPDTLIYCVHNVSRTGEIDVADEHHIVKG